MGEERKFLKSFFLPLLGVILVALLIAGRHYFLSPSLRKDRDEKKPSVLLITLDTCRADALGCYGGENPTPNLDLLAAEGTLFLNALCPAPITLPSHCSIMTGTRPPRHGVRDNGPYPFSGNCRTLGELFSGQGYKTAAFVSAAPLRKSLGLNAGFDTYNDDFPKSPSSPVQYPERRGEDTVFAANQWLEGIDEDPFFLWVHLFDPHAPHSPPLSYPQTYGGEVSYMDHCIGTLLKKPVLEKRERNLIVIAVADHGEGLGEHGEETHASYLYDTTMKVPFLLWGPGIIPADKKISAQTRLIDIAPTLVNLLDFPAQKSYQGLSLLPYLEGEEAEGLPAYGETFYNHLHFRWRQLVSLRTEEYKLILSGEEGALFHLRDDPREENNLFYQERAVVKELREILSPLMAEYSQSKPPSASAKTQLNLERLGYVTDFSSPHLLRHLGDKENQAFPCPMERVNDLRRFNQAVALCGSQNHSAALPILEELEKKDPGNPAIRFWIGRVYRKLADLDSLYLPKAHAAFSKALEILPSHSKALNLALAVLLQMRDPERGSKLIRDSKKNGSYNNRTMYLESHLEYMKGNRQKAAEILREYLKREPNDKKAGKFLDQIRPK